MTVRSRKNYGTQNIRKVIDYLINQTPFSAVNSGVKFQMETELSFLFKSDFSA